MLEAADALGGGLRIRRADAAGLRARRLLGGPSARASARRSSARSPLDVDWVHPGAPAAHPLDDGTAVVLERSLEETAERSAATARPTGELVEPLVEAWDELRRRCSAGSRSPPRRTCGPCAPLGAGPLALAAAPRSATPRRWPVAVRDGAGARLVRRALRRTRCSRSSAAPSAGFGLMLACSATPSAGRSRAAARSGSPTRSPARPPRRSAARSRRARRVDELAAGDRLVLARRDAARACRAWRGGRLPGALSSGGWRATATVRARSSSTGRSTGRSPGGPRNAHVPAPSTSAGRWRRSRRRRRRRGAGRRPSGHSCCSPSRASSTRRARRPGKHTAWAYCHVPNGSSVDMTERIEAQVERFAPGFRELVLARNTIGPAAIEALTGTTSAATSTAARWTSPAASVGRRSRLRDATPRRLPLLRLDAAGRRRPRDVRLLGCSRRA